MSVSSDTLEVEVEPFLLRSELIIRTPRGRAPRKKRLLCSSALTQPVRQKKK